jgi:hypothetical protein
MQSAHGDAGQRSELTSLNNVSVPFIVDEPLTCFEAKL